MSSLWDDLTGNGPVDQSRTVRLFTDPWRDDYRTARAWARNGFAAHIAGLVAEEESRHWGTYGRHHRDSLASPAPCLPRNDP